MLPNRPLWWLIGAFIFSVMADIFWLSAVSVFLLIGYLLLSGLGGWLNFADGLRGQRQENHYHDNRHINVFTEDGRSYRVNPRQLER